MPDIWRYIVVHDHGLAPCASDQLLTLCSCKPNIRKHAKIGDYILGFNNVKNTAGTILWAGIVEDKILMGDYEERFPNRPDALYKRVSWEPNGDEKLVHKGGKAHSTPSLIARDFSGKYSLLFKRFWYWGDKAIVFPDELKELIYQGRGQIKRLPDPKLLPLLETWLAKYPCGKLGNPRDNNPYE